MSVSQALKMSVAGCFVYEKKVQWHCDCYGADLKNVVTSLVKVEVVAMSLE